jgi:hypothetical protein
MDVTSAIAFYRDLVNERPLVFSEVGTRFIQDLSDLHCQDDLYECPICEKALESRDVIGFDQHRGITCIGYQCPQCNCKSKRPCTDLDYSLFLQSLSSKRSNKNRFFIL